MITKRFKTYVSLRNLGLSTKKIHCSLKESALLPKENSTLHGEIIFFIKEFLLFHEELA
jgi:hypothetical protein